MINLKDLKNAYGEENFKWKLISSLLGIISYLFCCLLAFIYTDTSIDIAIVFLIAAAMSMQLCIADIKIVKPFWFFFSKFFQWVPIIFAIVPALNKVVAI
ncbi:MULTISPECIES: hypothetical protein [Providencia]|uniref:hypothetical protein n=1 Tax=Providencia TaxID=586 RepID=UPI000BC45A0A|nr:MULTISPECIES: hypothetical protein [Providencia]MCG5378757.1 hypothetical protein [Providencia rettgeri]PCQ39504.1 hypothetical protein CQA26_02400 [Providencia rettgeri]BBU96720.1 hypothetical protein BML2496_26030 [Providencia rettgeri]